MFKASIPSCRNTLIASMLDDFYSFVCITIKNFCCIIWATIINGYYFKLEISFLRKN